MPAPGRVRQEARALIPSAQGTIQRLGREKATVLKEVHALRGQHEALAGAPQALVRAEHRAERARARASRFALLTAQAGEMARAQATLAEIDEELTALRTAAGTECRRRSAAGGDARGGRRAPSDRCGTAGHRRPARTAG